MLRTRWGPSPCDRLSRPPTTATPPPPPLGISWRRAFPPVRPRRTQVGPLGGFPRSLLHRSTGEVSNYAPAVSPRLRRSPSPWPPCRRSRPAREFPAPLRCQCAPPPSPDPSGSSWWVLEGRLTLVPCVHLPVPLAGPGPSDGAGLSRLCQGCLSPSPASPGVRLPSATSARCDGLKAVAFHHHTVKQRLVALEIGNPQAIRAGDRKPGRRRPVAAGGDRWWRGDGGRIPRALRSRASIGRCACD